MGRPKGSKNKVSELKPVVISKAEVKKEPTSIVQALPENIVDPKSVPPKPKKCAHPKASHFGGPFAELGGWCHEHGCDCMRYTNCQP